MKLSRTSWRKTRTLVVQVYPGPPAYTGRSRLHLAPFETEGGGNAVKSQDLWIGDTIRFPSPAPKFLMIRLPLHLETAENRRISVGPGFWRRQKPMNAELKHGWLRSFRRLLSVRCERDARGAQSQKNSRPQETPDYLPRGDSRSPRGV